MASTSLLLSRIRSHPLIHTLIALKGNPRVCVLIEPFWGIPNSLIAPFTAVYMRAMGVDNVQIGIALSAAMLAQVICAFFGGIIADKLGRRLTTALGDLVGWVIPCAIWAAAQNYWFFLAAMVLNSFEQVNQTAWVCLLVEDAEEKDILHIWNWIMIAGLIAVFFSPLSGALIRGFSLVPVMRALYGLYSLSMLIKCLISLRYTTETRQGRIRRAQTKGESILRMAFGYWRLLPKVIRDEGTLRVLAVMVVLNITVMVNQNFYSLYASAGLGIPEIFSPPGRPVVLVFYTLVEAVAFGIVLPRKELMSAVFVNKQERARIIALLTTMTIAIAMPFGAITGLLSKLDGRLPFVLSFSLFLFLFAVISTMKKDPGPQLKDEAEQES